MPSKNKHQQRFFGVVRAIQEGKFKGSPSKDATKAAKSMSVSDVRDFAKYRTSK